MFNKQRVLVVYTESQSAKQASVILRLAGYQIILCEDGRRAAELAVESNPDAIFVDIDVNSMEQSAICGWIRDQQSLRADLGVVFAIDPQLVKGIANLAKYQTVTKPVNTDELISTIEQVVSDAMEKKQDKNAKAIVPPLNRWNSMDQDLLQDIGRINSVIESFEEADKQAPVVESNATEQTIRPSDKPSRRSSGDVTQ